MVEPAGNMIGLAVAIVGGLFALLLLVVAGVYLVRKGWQALWVILGWLLGVVITLALDLRLMILLSITFCVTATFLKAPYTDTALWLSHWTFVLAIVFLLIGLWLERLFHRFKPIATEGDSRDFRTALARQMMVFVAAQRVTAGIYGFIGLLLGYAMSLYMLDRKDLSSFGGPKFHFDEYLGFALHDTFDAVRLGQLLVSSFNGGRPLTERSIEAANSWALTLQWVFGLAIGAWLVSFAAFILLELTGRNERKAA